MHSKSILKEERRGEVAIGIDSSRTFLNVAILTPLQEELYHKKMDLTTALSRELSGTLKALNTSDCSLEIAIESYASALSDKRGIIT
ncbi:MAG: hypothetical protein AB1630_13175 [bacterium]